MPFGKGETPIADIMLLIKKEKCQSMLIWNWNTRFLMVLIQLKKSQNVLNT